MTRWKSFRYRLEEAACAWLVRTVPRLSRRQAVRLGYLLGSLAFLLDRRGRAVAAANLDCVFGDRRSPREKRELTRSSYHNFARTMVDLFWGQRFTEESIKKWVRTEGMEELHEVLARTGRGAICMCVHQGNWEWGGLLGSFVNFSLTTVAENFKNPRLTAIFSALRQHTGQVIIPQENSLLKMLRVVRKGGITAMLIDLNLRPSQAATVVRAFGQPGLEMCVPLIHAVLAQRAGALLIPVETESYPDGTWRIRAHPPLTPPEDATLQQIAQLCWDYSEKLVLERPGQWLWPYKHFRYRPRDASRPYPFYSHESGKFEKLRRNEKLA